MGEYRNSTPPQYGAFISIGTGISCHNQQADCLREISELHSDLGIDEQTGGIWLPCSGCSLSNSRAVMPWKPHLLPIFALNYVISFYLFA